MNFVDCMNKYRLIAFTCKFVRYFKSIRFVNSTRYILYLNDCATRPISY